MYWNYNDYSDSQLLKLDDDQIHGIMDIDTWVRIARIAPSRLTEEQLKGAEHKLKNKVIIDESDVSFMLDIIKKKNMLYSLPSKDNFNITNRISTEDVREMLKSLSIDDFIPSPDGDSPRYIGDVILTFKSKKPLVISDELRIDEPIIQIKVDTDRSSCVTWLLIIINALE